MSARDRIIALLKMHPEGLDDSVGVALANEMVGLDAHEDVRIALVRRDDSSSKMAAD